MEVKIGELTDQFAIFEQQLKDKDIELEAKDVELETQTEKLKLEAAQ